MGPYVGYGDDEEGVYLFTRVCPKCGRFVKADKTSKLCGSSEPNATCSRCGRVRMPEEGWEL